MQPETLTPDSAPDICPDCGAALAHIAGGEYPATLCPECDRDFMPDPYDLLETLEKPMATTKTKKALLAFPCKFGNVSIGAGTASIRIKVGRSDLQVSKADNQLCEHRCTGRLVTKPAGESEDQGTLDGLAEDEELAGVFDVKSFNVTADEISMSASFALRSVDVSHLAHFAQRAGRVIVEDVEAIEDDDQAEEEEE